jgi:surface protein
LKTGTIFRLGGDIWGYDIELFNFYKEKEILLEPERKFIVDDVLPPLNDVINITCNILKTNLILSDDEVESNLISYNTNEDVNKDKANISDYVIKFEMEAKINGEIKYTKGICVLCNIPSKKIKALITYNHMMNFDFLNKGEKMILYINKKENEININTKRYKYTNKDLDITIIEILDNDNIKNFIEIDKFINSRNYTGTNIISVSLNDNEDFDLSYSKIIEKNNDNYICNIESIKEGLIILKDNMKLIGIIKEKEEKINIIPMNIIINKINFIKGIYEIKKDDIGKDIQLINSKDDLGNIKNEEIEKNIKIIINGEIESNILKYKFNKEGDYIIYFISYNELTNMSGMFYNCSLLKKLDLSSFNTNQVTNMSHMFYNCSSLKELNLSLFNTNQVTNMSSMFRYCFSLEKLDLSSFNTNQVINMS